MKLSSSSRRAASQGLLLLCAAPPAGRKLRAWGSALLQPALQTSRSRVAPGRGAPGRARGSGSRSRYSRAATASPPASELAGELRLQLAGPLQLGGGLLKTTARREAPPPVDAKARGLLQGEATGRRAARDYRVHGPWRRMLWRPIPASPATARTSWSRARVPLILASVSPAREMRRVRDLPVRERDLPDELSNTSVTSAAPAGGSVSDWRR